jgi:TolB-like protein
MIYRFGVASFDTQKGELRSNGALVAIEPQVFALLRLLIENRERLVSRDEIVERVWNGRIVSEAAISSRIKSVRQAIGDDGAAQRLIRTVPKRGFRFVGEVVALEPATVCAEAATEGHDEPAPRPSIAVLPFEVIGAGSGAQALAEALPHDLIAELSRLRWLFVIARGSSFRFRGPNVDINQVRAALRVRYCLSGSVEIDAGTMALTVELCDTTDGGVLWSERFRGPIEAAHEIRERIVQAVIGALELQIPLNEAKRAQLKSPENLDAWSAYHLGLHQMYRFSQDGAALATTLFEQAIALEPGFARAHAGLSFCHFERAFLNFTDQPQAAAGLARAAAEAGLEQDPLDPFCNLVMGRVFWLSGELEASLPWLDRAIALNPNYAQAKYARAWTETLMGQAVQGQANTDTALRLSPLDPMAYGMFGVRAFTHMVLDEPAEAARWGERAACAPGAHSLIELMAAIGHNLNGEPARARFWIDSARRRTPDLSSAQFHRAFPFRDGNARRRISRALDQLGV